MKALRLIPFLVLCLCTAASAQKAPIYGAYSWYEGIEKARSEGKSFLMFISQKGCPYCKQLDKSIAENPAVIAFLQQKFVLARHSVSKPYGKAIAFDRHLQTTPALLIQNPAWEDDPLILYGVVDAAVLQKKLEEYLAEGKKQ